MKWTGFLAGIFLIVSLATPIGAQEVYQPYNSPRNPATFGPGGQVRQPSNNAWGSSWGPGIQVQQNNYGPWGATNYGPGGADFQQYNNSWGVPRATPPRR